MTKSQQIDDGSKEINQIGSYQNYIQLGIIGIKTKKEGEIKLQLCRTRSKEFAME